MTNEQYNEYLKSEEWQIKRNLRLEIDGRKCCMCGCTGTMNNPLQVHHFTYHNLGCENIYRDIVTVCTNCHKSIHKLMARKTDPNGRNGWTDKAREYANVIESEL